MKELNLSNQYLRFFDNSGELNPFFRVNKEGVIVLTNTETEMGKRDFINSYEIVPKLVDVTTHLLSSQQKIYYNAKCGKGLFRKDESGFYMVHCSHGEKAEAYSDDISGILEMIIDYMNIHLLFPERSEKINSQNWTLH